MKEQAAQLVHTLSQKKAVFQELRALLEQEQSFLVALDLMGMELSQQALGEVMAKMERISGTCRTQIGALAARVGVPEATTLSPVLERLGQPERGALKEAQDAVMAESAALARQLALHRSLLQDSLQMVHQSVNFFNRLFNPVDTYGNAGSLVARRGGSRFICKEI